eukprot:jgi/Ulvmu1/1293/UM011_0017.1
MVVAAIIGLGLGMTGGIMIGGQIFKNSGDVEEAKYKNYDIVSDNDENVPEPIVTGIVTKEYREVLKYAPKWTTFPDFEQVRWLNSTIEWLWPGLNKAICKQVIDILKPILEDVVAQQPLLDAVRVEELDLGPLPMRLAGLKVYDTKDDEVIIEAPIQWGSAIKVHVAAWVRVGPASLYVPVKVEDVQLDALARITFRPLVDKLPCIGAVSVCLMDTPFVDLTLKLLNDWDIMSLPFVHDAVLMGAKIGAEPQVVYPNQIHVPLMPNSGLPKPPVGMLEITVVKATGLRSADTFSKGDPYVRISVQERKMPEDDDQEGAASKVNVEDEVVVLKEHPSHQTVHHKNTKNPEFNEHFKILVPDLGPHVVLNFLMMDYDLIGNDEAMAEYDLPLDKADEEADFLRDTSEAYPKALTLRPVRKKGAVRSTKSQGELRVSLHFTPFFSADAPEEGAEEDPAKVMEALARSQKARPISDTLKGVVTVDLARCTDLPVGSKGTNSYVEVKLMDPDSPEGPDARRTAVVINEASPRFREKFDFVYVSATSMLTLTVFEKVGALDVGNILKLGRKEDEMLGKVRIPVKDVVKPGRLKDAFPLQEAEQGDMHLTLSWQAVERDE